MESSKDLQGILLRVPFFPVMLSPALLLSKLRANNLRFLLFSSPDDTLPDFWLNKQYSRKILQNLFKQTGSPGFVLVFNGIHLKSVFCLQRANGAWGKGLQRLTELCKSREKSLNPGRFCSMTTGSGHIDKVV